MEQLKMSKQQVIDYIKNCPAEHISISSVAAASGKTEATIKRHFSQYIDAKLGKAAKGSEFSLDDLMTELKAIRNELAYLKKIVKIDPASWVYPSSFYGIALDAGADVSFLYEDETISSVIWGESYVPKIKVCDGEFGPEYEYGKMKGGKLVKIVAYKVVSNGAKR